MKKKYGIAIASVICAVTVLLFFCGILIKSSKEEKTFAEESTDVFAAAEAGSLPAKEDAEGSVPEAETDMEAEARTEAEVAAEGERQTETSMASGSFDGIFSQNNESTAPSEEVTDSSDHGTGGEGEHAPSAPEETSPVDGGEEESESEPLSVSEDTETKYGPIH